jgi:hypothetical protein
LRFSERLNQTAREGLRALIGRDSGWSAGSCPRGVNRIADDAAGAELELGAIGRLDVAADLDPAGAIVRVDDQDACPGVHLEIAITSVVRGRVYEDGTVVDVTPDWPGLGLPSRQPRAQRGNEVAIEEVTMGRRYVDRPAQRWSCRPVERGRSITSWRMNGLHIGQDPERGDPALYLDLTGAQFRRNHTAEIAVLPVYSLASWSRCASALPR